MNFKNFFSKSKGDWNELLCRLKNHSANLIQAHPFLSVLAGFCAGLVVGLAFKILFVLLVLAVLVASIIYILAPDEKNSQD